MNTVGHDEDCYANTVSGYNDPSTSARGVLAFWSGRSVELHDGSLVQFQFKFDSTKLFLEVANLSASSQWILPFFHRQHEIIFTDGTRFVYNAPFGTFFDYADMFVILQGEMGVLQFDKTGKPNGVQAINSDSALLQKMLTVPMREIITTGSYDPRFKHVYEYYPKRHDEQHTRSVWKLPVSSGREVMGFLRCIYAEIQNQQR